jgi:hypothetical protein
MRSELNTEEGHMVQSSLSDENEKQAMTKEKKERDEQAQKLYCDVCEESGLKVSSWQNFDAWKEFVDGKVNEAVLTEKAETELVEFAKSFGKYLVIEKEDPTASDDADKKERAKRANRIYRKLCEASGLTLCFLSSFSTWSDFVEGRITESEFLEQAKLEVEKMVRQSG